MNDSEGFNFIAGHPATRSRNSTFSGQKPAYEFCFASVGTHVLFESSVVYCHKLPDAGNMSPETRLLWLTGSGVEVRHARPTVPDSGPQNVPSVPLDCTTVS